MATSTGFSVRIFIPSGEPEGVRIVEKSNWTGHGLIFPRSLLTEARQRPELKRTGVYILWGPGESGSLPRVYVGQGDEVLSRLTQHGRAKDFWTHAAVFTSKDDNLNNAHGQYLEARLVQLAAEAKRSELDNGNRPQLPALSEADAADAEAFLSDMLLCLPVVGVALFEQPRLQASESPSLFLRSRGIEAQGTDGVDGFVVRQGSQAAKEETPSCHGFLRELRRSLLDQGVLADAGRVFEITQDYTFSSPSNAAGVLLGRASNGRTEWKDAQGRSLKSLQEAETGNSESSQ